MVTDPEREALKFFIQADTDNDGLVSAVELGCLLVESTSLADRYIDIEDCIATIFKPYSSSTVKAGSVDQKEFLRLYREQLRPSHIMRMEEEEAKEAELENELSLIQMGEEEDEFGDGNEDDAANEVEDVVERSVAEIYEDAMNKVREAAEAVPAAGNSGMGSSLNLKAVFCAIDTDKSGLLSEIELFHAFKELGVELDEEEFYIIYDAFDQGGISGADGIDYGEFLYAFHNRRSIEKALQTPQPRFGQALKKSAGPGPGNTSSYAVQTKKITATLEAPPLEDIEPSGLSGEWTDQEYYGTETPEQRKTRIESDKVDLEIRRKQAEIEKVRRIKDRSARQQQGSSIH